MPKENNKSGVATRSVSAWETLFPPLSINHSFRLASEGWSFVSLGATQVFGMLGDRWRIRAMEQPNRGVMAIGQRIASKLIAGELGVLAGVWARFGTKLTPVAANRIVNSSGEELPPEQLAWKLALANGALSPMTAFWRILQIQKVDGISYSLSAKRMLTPVGARAYFAHLLPFAVTEVPRASLCFWVYNMMMRGKKLPARDASVVDVAKQVAVPAACVSAAGTAIALFGETKSYAITLGIRMDTRMWGRCFLVYGGKNLFVDMLLLLGVRMAQVRRQEGEENDWIPVRHSG